MSLIPYVAPDYLSSLPRGNLLLNSQAFAAAPWSAVGAVISGSFSDPYGGATAEVLVSAGAGNDYIGQTVAVNGAGRTWTFSIWLMAGDSGSPVYVTLKDGAGAVYANRAFNLDGTWLRCSVTATFPPGAAFGVQCYIDPVVQASAAGQHLVYLWGAQLEPWSTAGLYIATNSAPSYGVWGGVGGLPVLPFLPGQTPQVSKAPQWSTKVNRSASGRERRTAFWAYPLWRFELKYEVLRHRPLVEELFALWAFFNAAQGQFGPWLFVDPSDCQLTAPFVFATGDGATTSFQLTRPVDGWVEPVYAAYLPSVTVAGAPETGFSLSPNGVVTFAAAPASGAELAWSGYFYFGCRFEQDDLGLIQIVDQLWSGDSLKFTSLRV